MTQEQKETAASVVVWGPDSNPQFYERYQIQRRIVALLERLERKGLLDETETQRTVSDSQTL